MSSSEYQLNWADLAFGSKRSINDLGATFIAAPRQISDARFMQLVKEYLPKGNIVLGIANEDYIDGFDLQPQFQTLKANDVISIINKVNTSNSPHKIYTLNYHQKESVYLFEKLKFKKVLLINGSWLHAFHTRKEYYTLVNRGVAFELISPFINEAEAREFITMVGKPDTKIPSALVSTIEALALAANEAHYSYDYSFQTGAVLGRKQNESYKVLATSFNKVVPYQTYAMHHGASREVNFSPPNDLNHYDTVHAEVEILIEAQKQKIDLNGTTLFINLMPCPTCSRMLADTDIAEVMYQIDHSDGYAVKMLEAAGKTVTRVVS